MYAIVEPTGALLAFSFISFSVVKATQETFNNNVISWALTQEHDVNEICDRVSIFLYNLVVHCKENVAFISFPTTVYCLYLLVLWI